MLNIERVADWVKWFRKAFTGVQPRTYFIDTRTFGSDYLRFLSAESILKCVPRGQHKYFEAVGTFLSHPLLPDFRSLTGTKPHAARPWPLEDRGHLQRKVGREAMVSGGGRVCAGFQ